MSFDLFLVFEYLPSENLLNKIRRVKNGSVITQDRVLEITKSLLEALNFLHRA